jgi:hypothetical protein
MFAVLLEEAYTSIVKHLEERELGKSAKALQIEMEKDRYRIVIIIFYYVAFLGF